MSSRDELGHKPPTNSATGAGNKDAHGWASFLVVYPQDRQGHAMRDMGLGRSGGRRRPSMGDPWAVAVAVGA
jgi:hypothetical protein